MAGLTREGLHEELQNFYRDVLKDALADLRLQIIADLGGKKPGEYSSEDDKTKDKQRSVPTLGVGFRKARILQHPHPAANKQSSKEAEVYTGNNLYAAEYAPPVTAYVELAENQSSSNNRLPPPNYGETELMREESDSLVSLVEDGEAAADDISGGNASFLECAHHRVSNFVHGSFFQYSTCAAVLLNAALIGACTEYKIRHLRRDEPRIFALLDALFCVVFTVELCCRFVAFGCSMFFTKGWAWNVFDLIVVSFQLSEILLHTLFSQYESDELLGTLKFLRLIRIIRLMRVLRLIEDLREIASSIVGSLRSLMWTLLLLLMLMYSCGVCITQVVAEYLLQSDEPSSKTEDLRYYFGSIGRSVLSLFESITGGQSWDIILEPLMEDISFLVAPVFCVYISFCLFAVMNSVTGVFVEKAMSRVHEDQEKYLAHTCAKVFARAENHLLTSDQFCEQMQSEEFIDFFGALDIHVEESEGFFALLDVEKEGVIGFEQFLHGILRVRGPAKSLDLTLLMHECEYMFTRISEHMLYVDNVLKKMSSSMTDGFAREVSIFKSETGTVGSKSRAGTGDAFQRCSL